MRTALVSLMLSQVVPLPAVRDAAPRVFDLVLFSPNADLIVRRIREEEVGGAVDFWRIAARGRLLSDRAVE